MKSRFLTAAVALAMISGPAGAQQMQPDTWGLRFEKDDFRGTSSVYTDQIALDGSGILSKTLSFGMQLKIAKDSTRKLGIVLQYRGASWMFIDAGESLLFIIDDSTSSLRGDGSSRMRTTIGREVLEFAYYETTTAFLEKLQSSRVTRLKVVGDRFDIEGSLTIEHRALLGRFLKAAATTK